MFSSLNVSEGQRLRKSFLALRCKISACGAFGGNTMTITGFVEYISANRTSRDASNLIDFNTPYAASVTR